MASVGAALLCSLSFLDRRRDGVLVRIALFLGILSHRVSSGNPSSLPGGSDAALGSDLEHLSSSNGLPINTTVNGALDLDIDPLMEHYGGSGSCTESCC
jgi:hypothetical protein